MSSGFGIYTNRRTGEKFDKSLGSRYFQFSKIIFLLFIYILVVQFNHFWVKYKWIKIDQLNCRCLITIEKKKIRWSSGISSFISFLFSFLLLLFSQFLYKIPEIWWLLWCKKKELFILECFFFLSCSPNRWSCITGRICTNC